MTEDDLKRRVWQAIDRHGEELIGLGERIRRHPELGFKEVKTARLVEDTLSRLGLKPRAGLALTGVRADLAGKAGPGPTFALLAELDALVVAGHPGADPETGAAHACGHNAQVAGLLGCAMGLSDAQATEHLAGRVVVFAVPAEEYGDIEWRVSQARQGKLEFLGGNPELLRLGHLDAVHPAMMLHAPPRPEAGPWRRSSTPSAGSIAGCARGRWPSAPRWRSRRCRATCRCSATPPWPTTLNRTPSRWSARSITSRSDTARAPRTWAISRR